jgi:hypothetical protein
MNRTVCAIGLEVQVVRIARMLMVIALVLFASAFELESATARTNTCPQRPQEMPCLTVVPNAGPIGTTVELRGRIGHRYAEWRGFVRATPFITFNRPFPDGCGGYGGSDPESIRISPDGHVTGSFVVNAELTCTQTDEHHHPMTPGAYDVVAGCKLCTVAEFRVTRSSGGLAPTGSRTATAMALAACAIVSGLCLSVAGRRKGSIVSVGWSVAPRVRRSSRRS